MAQPYDKNHIENYYNSSRPVYTLYRILQMNIWRLLLFLIVFTIKHLPVLITPLYLRYTIAIVKEPTGHEIYDLWLINIIFFIVILQNLPSHMLFAKMVIRRIRTMEHRLRAALIRKLQQLSITFHTGSKSGRLQSKVLRDVDNVVQMGNHLFHIGFTNVVSITWSLAIAFSNDYIVGIFFVVCMPIAGFLIYKFKSKMAAHNRSYRIQLESMNSSVAEMINSIPVSRAHGIEQSEIRKADKYFHKIYKAGSDVDMVNQIFNASTWMSLKTAMTAVIAFTAFLVFYGKMPLENIMMFNSLFVLVLHGIHSILSFMPFLARGLESVKSIGEVLESPDLEYNQGKETVSQVKGAIKYDHIYFSYNNRQNVIKDFSLDIRPGECIAFVGESGAGKSTIVNMTIGFWRPQQGQILLDQIDYNNIDMRSWRQHLAVVPQNTILFSGTIRENITYGLNNISDAKLTRTVEAANLTTTINNLPDKINTYIGENGLTLSGGQRQRVAIARALIRDPAVIILDEATSSLDVVSENQVQKAINNLIQNRTTLIVAHRLSTIRHADRIIVMKKGKIIEQGTQEQLLQLNGEFAKLKNLQN